MRLTQKAGREQLIPINPNIQPVFQSRHGHHSSTHNSQEKNKVDRSSKNEKYEIRINSLQSVVKGFKNENEESKMVSRNQSQDSLSLKVSYPQTPKEHQRIQKENPQINNIRYHNEDQSNKMTFELDKAIYQNNALRKENDELKKYIQDLERSKGGSLASISSQNNQMSLSISNPHISKMVEQYEDHIAAMAGKISSMHRIELDVANLTKEKAILLKDFEEMRQELRNRISYCEHLENELKSMDAAKIKNSKPQPNQLIPVVDTEILVKYRALEVEVVKLSKEIEQKDEKINEYEQKNDGLIQVSKDKYEDLEANVFSLTERLDTSTKNYEKETQKSAKLQIEINRLNFEIGEKIRKLEAEEDTIKRLENEKSDMITNITKTKAELKQLEKKYEDKTTKLDKITEDYEKVSHLNVLTQECIRELEILKKKSKESDDLCKKQQAKIDSLTLKYNDIEIENKKAFDHLRETLLKHENYERVIKEQNIVIRKLNDQNSQRLEELDVNISNNIELQNKLRELYRRNSVLTDEIEQCIIENYYVKPVETPNDIL